ncbi:uncharacterized protein LOC144650941 [Oculina patagonica]
MCFGRWYDFADNACLTTLKKVKNTISPVLDMEFYSAVMVANGTISLIFACLACFGSIILIIAVVKNPLNVTRKAIHRIEDVSLVLYLLAGTVLLPYFGVTEILRGVNNELETFDFPSFTSLLTDFLIASKLAMLLLMNIERYAAYTHPHFHRVKITKRAAYLVSLSIVSLCLLCSCLSFTGIDERTYYIVYIHLFCSCSWLAFIVVCWLTYRKLKNRSSRVAPDESIQLPQQRKKAEFERARNALGARKYLQKFAMFYLPMVISILPWYIVRCMTTVCDVCLANKAGFFWQRFAIPFAFASDAFYTLWFVFNGEFTNTLKYIFCDR